MEIDLKILSNEELSSLVSRVQIEITSRVQKQYAELVIHAHAYKGTGKAWVQAYHDGQRAGFVDTYNVEKDGYKYEKTFHLAPGVYLVNEAGSKSHDSRYKIRVNPDFTIERL